MSAKRPSGFTLVELLVVVSLITLLVALILPALGRVRAIGKGTVCESNLRQNASAVLDYSLDNGDFYPPNVFTGECVNATWPFADTNTCMPWSRNVKAYLAGDGTLTCPAGERPTLWNAYDPAGTEQYASEISDYGFNNYLHQSATKPYRTKSFAKTHYHFLMGDAWLGWWDTWRDYTRMVPRHSERVNFVMLDGHVEALWKQPGSLLDPNLDAEFRSQPDRLRPDRVHWVNAGGPVFP